MGENKNRIYLDYAATTPVDPEVFEAMKPYFGDDFGNPSSAHQFGQKARQGLDKARAQVAEFFGCKPEEIIFTSGATESNNLAIKGVIYKIQNSKFKIQSLPHVITSQIEHHCVLDTCKNLEETGFAQVTYLPVNKEGLVEIEALEKVIKENTVLVSIMYANNEIGTVQPIEEIGKLIKKLNQSRQQKIYFHTDAVQAINYLNCKVDALQVDLLSMSAHKFYGPKGVGALYIRKGTPVKKIQDGGAHEYDLRAGTYNIGGIVGLGKAITMINSQTAQRIKKLRDKMVEEVLKLIPNSKLNGSRQHRLQNNANFSFPGAEGESIMMALDQERIAVSTGSACASENLQPSHVLTALGLKPEESHTSIRVTLGKYTKEEEIDRFLEVLPKVVERLRQISGSGKADKKKLPDDFGC
ncbi:MAG: cysteine desulfurase NifS [Candidatus Portnoybacteria bacterium CG_4_8_14_3_um_filter_40_10]|uniref:cysteine desulfurase n=2 Tax=Candidatus Portnoyibacteriota TaxID=1817913 RepID=A0A2M7IHS1_9BACT|nr:MAG: cysteine desulfurase NifS [Candidatus Portnoybacteria bacterium CG11_big_fil_rev_8_21_14_0_20_40_15]PIS30836.1 MAG: cysteine desulfurase NifS [Candidatus Portnoybacteria bacterium CG08_land_8_20_14_0_20_40_83]PIW76008.1 MAG: cysteine desulfurase NifS [Candidatus Portnoybacteria bacterium CG_4_8_14_3_um_filter_40_10]